MFISLFCDRKTLQAKQRIQVLEKSVSEAQTSESQVSDLQRWICRVDDLLNDYMENDTTVQDMPHDFQVFALEKKYLKLI